MSSLYRLCSAAERAHCATGKSLAASRELTTLPLAADGVPVALCALSPVFLRVISAWLLSSLFSAAVCLAFSSSPSVLASVSKLLPSPQHCTVNAHFRPHWTPVRSNRVSCMSLQWQHHTSYTLFVTAPDYIPLSLVRECMDALAKLLNGNCRFSGWFGGGQQAEQGVWWGSQ